LKNKIRIKTIAIITSVILFLAVTPVISYYLSGINPEVSLARYVRTEYTLDYQEFAKYCAYDADGLLKEMYKDSGYTTKVITAILAEQSQKAVAELKEIYGYDFKITITITGSRPFKESMFQNSIAGIESTFEYLEYDLSQVIDIGKITEMIEYEYEVLIAGSKGEMIHQGAMLMAKVKSRWGALPNMF